MIAYHDVEWGLPLHEDQQLFEFLILEGAQAGLSWSTILNKRAAYRKAFANFDPLKVANFGKKEVDALMSNAGIVRNRRKIESAIKNAKVFLSIQEKYGSFDSYIWDFVDGSPINNQFVSMAEIPAETDLSRAISKDLKKRGMSFVGPTIIYAFMQAVGIVNDHLVDCFRYSEIKND
jgi:DNA-3-methyladenine glycosylase I